MAGILGKYMPFAGGCWEQLPNVSVKRINEVNQNPTTGDNKSRYLVPLQLAMINYNYTDWAGPADGVSTAAFRKALKEHGDNAIGATTIPMSKTTLKAILYDGDMEDVSKLVVD